MKLLITGGAGFSARAWRARCWHAARWPDRPSATSCSPTRRQRPTDLRADPRVAPASARCSSSARRCATRPSTASSTWPRRCPVNARPTSISACARTWTARARCSTRCVARQRRGAATRLVFSSSVAVFGPDAAVPMPAIVADDTLPAPQTSYGTHKLVCEHLIADYTRKGYHRRPRRAADDGDGAPRAAERRGVVVLQRHHPRAARGRRVGLPGVRRGLAPGVVAVPHGRKG